MTPEEFAKFALDRGRLAVLGLLAVGAQDTDALVEATGQDRRAVLEALGVLAVEGLVARDDADGWVLQESGLVAVAEQLHRPPPPAPRVFFGMTTEEGEVLARYTTGNRLSEIPSKRSHRLVVLERLALEFDPGERYEERRVNGMLSLWHPDYAALRRALVDEGFMDRGGGEYWRAGGRVTGLD
ncbi:DUF2087 domain-containing protein [Euzebya rosea]|uniref:DUF2087 domain-containing protein n=1 Tax=Euzebya rosea TaxID=2052804 RepID=UPI000D3E072F|nr:DUF2087 domain-containing protein [Euzebya rosea]